MNDDNESLRRLRAEYDGPLRVDMDLVRYDWNDYLWRAVLGILYRNPDGKAELFRLAEFGVTPEQALNKVVSEALWGIRRDRDGFRAPDAKQGAQKPPDETA